MSVTKELEMFGCRKEDIEHGVELYSMGAPKNGKLSKEDYGCLFLAMSIQSDVQELVSMGHSRYNEQIRHFLNRSKYLISKVMKGE